jgi:hypothetical protein
LERLAVRCSASGCASQNELDGFERGIAGAVGGAVGGLTLLAIGVVAFDLPAPPSLSPMVPALLISAVALGPVAGGSAAAGTTLAVTTAFDK